jgi:hypothetical protein
MRIYISGNHADRKYVIAHEVGHALIFIHGKETYGWNMYDVGYGAFGYSNAFGDLGDPQGRSAGPDCEWIADSHHLHSLESSNAAFEEGWAQFVATASWNSEEETDAFFHYYKDGADEVDMENGPLGGVTAYIRNVCDCEGDALGASCPGDSPMKEGWGVELDWARAFWDLHTPGGNPASTPNVHLDWAEMIAVAAAAREGMDHDEAAQRVSEEMPPEMVDKWEHVAEHNGLVPEGTFGLTTGED